VIQVDGRTGLVADTTDGSTTLTDNITDLVRMDLDGGDARSALRQLGAGLGDNLVHLVQDVQTRSVGLLQGDFHDFVGNTLDFDIHLQGSYAVFGTGNLEVHVAQVIFVTQDVCQNPNLSPSLTRPMAIPATGAFRGTPASIRAREEPHT